jgi:glycolate oxidase
MVDSYLQKLAGTEIHEALSTDLFERRFYSQDLSSIPPFAADFLVKRVPHVLVKPRDREEIARVVKCSSDCNMPVTPRASGTTALFNSVPVRGGVLLDLTGLKGVIDLDRENETVNVYAGTRWKELDEELRLEGYALKTYPTSAPSSTVGGWFNTGGLGIGSLKHGCMHHLVKSAKAVLPNGGTRILGDDSFPALRSFAGAEGTLGVITELELSVRRAPESTAQHLYGYGDIEDLLEAALAISASSSIPYHLHFNDMTFSRMIRKAGFDTDLPQDQNLLHVRYEGGVEEVKEGGDKAASLCLKGCGEEIGNELTEEHWNSRFSEVRIKRAGPTLLGVEVLLPLRNLVEFMAKVRNIGKRANLPICVYGSIVSPEHCQLNAFYPSDERKGFTYLLSMSLTGKLHRAAISSGGRPYGVGVWNTPYIKNIYGPKELSERRKLKTLIDPNDIMNPGKVYYPTHLFFRKPFFGMGMNTLSALHILNTMKKTGN